MSLLEIPNKPLFRFSSRGRRKFFEDEKRRAKLFYPMRPVQCDHIVAETPNLDVLGIEMSLIFGKCRLAFFGVFKPKRAIFLAFLY